MSYGINCEITGIYEAGAPTSSGATSVGDSIWTGAVAAYMRDESQRRIFSGNTGQDKQRRIYLRAPLASQVGLPLSQIAAGDTPNGYFVSVTSNSMGVLEGDYRITSAEVIAIGSTVDSYRLDVEPV